MDDKSKLSIEQMLGMARELSMTSQCRDVIEGSIDNLKQSLDPNGLGGKALLPNEDADERPEIPAQQPPKTIPQS